MKKIFKQAAIVAAMTLAANTLSAQGVYVNLNSSYNVGMGTNIEGFTNGSNSSGSSGNSTYQYEQVKATLGKGLSFGGGIGYMFNKYVGAELGVSYLIGGKNTAKYTSTYNNSTTTTKMDLSAKMLRFMPSIIISAGGNKFNPYAKLGLLIGSGSILYELNENNGKDIIVSNLKLSGGMAGGLQGGIGLNIKVSKKIDVFGEINSVNMSYAPTKGKIIVATYNGKDRLPDMTTSEKEIQYVDSYSYTSGANTSAQASKALKTKLPFTSIGINVGLKIGF